MFYSPCWLNSLLICKTTHSAQNAVDKQSSQTEPFILNAERIFALNIRIGQGTHIGVQQLSPALSYKLKT